MIATTIEQSKQLLEAGIDPQTADMRWETIPGFVSHLCYEHCVTPLIAPEVTPAWSLSAIIHLLPEHIFWRIARVRGKDVEGIFEDCVNYLCKEDEKCTKKNSRHLFGKRCRKV